MSRVLVSERRVAHSSGWSRSASSSVWGGARLDKTEPATAPGSPAESDDEEYEADVDYDDVRLFTVHL